MAQNSAQTNSQGAIAQRFAGKTVLITGGNSGMGFVTAKRIVAEGGRVIITGRDEKSLQQAQQELGSQAESIRSDVSNLKDIAALFETIKNKYGKIDGVFANAGIAKFGDIEKVTEDDFDILFDINVKGLFFTLQKSIPVLAPNASLVLNASVLASRGGTVGAVYGATKAAVRSFARSFSSSFVDRGFRFNVVSPGPIDTPIWGREGGGIPKEAVNATKDAIASTNPMKRYGQPEEVAAVIAFLLSSESSYMLGAEVMVDGGANQL